MTAPQYPICLTVEGRSCLVVGGGTIAARKAAELVRCGARVKVVSPEVSPEMQRLRVDGTVVLVSRAFEDHDVEGAFVVVAATDDLAVNEQVASAAKSVRSVVNVVDQPQLCEFTAPAVLRRGRLTVAVSTGGSYPGMAGHIRTKIDETLESEWADILEKLGSFRRDVLERFPEDPDCRREVLERAMALELVEIVRRDGPESLMHTLNEIIAGDAEATR